jgi:hypothetical protein
MTRGGGLKPRKETLLKICVPERKEAAQRGVRGLSCKVCFGEVRSQD